MTRCDDCALRSAASACQATPTSPMLARLASVLRSTRAIATVRPASVTAGSTPTHAVHSSLSLHSSHTFTCAPAKLHQRSSSLGRATRPFPSLLACGSALRSATRHARCECSRPVHVLPPRVTDELCTAANNGDRAAIEVLLRAVAKSKSTLRKRIEAEKSTCTAAEKGNMTYEHEITAQFKR